MMRWSRFFWVVGLLIFIFCAILALGWYVKRLEVGRLGSMAADVGLISMAGLILALIIPTVKRRWWRKPVDQSLVRQRFGVSFYVFWGIFFLNFATYMAITIRAREVKRELFAPGTEIGDLFQAMSTVSTTLIFACLILMVFLVRAVHDQGSGENGDQGP